MGFAGTRCHYRLHIVQITYVLQFYAISPTHTPLFVVLVGTGLGLGPTGEREEEVLMWLLIHFSSLHSTITYTH